MIICEGIVENCCNDESYGCICVRCNKCGRFDKANDIADQAKIEQLQSDIDQMRIAKIADNLHEMEAIKERAELVDKLAKLQLDHDLLTAISEEDDRCYARLLAEFESVNTANRELHSANEYKKAKLDAVRIGCSARSRIPWSEYAEGWNNALDRILAILDGDT